MGNAENLHSLESTMSVMVIWNYILYTLLIYNIKSLKLYFISGQRFQMISSFYDLHYIDFQFTVIKLFYLYSH